MGETTYKLLLSLHPGGAFFLGLFSASCAKVLRWILWAVLRRLSHGMLFCVRVSCEAHSHRQTLWGSLAVTLAEVVRLVHIYITSVRLTHIYIKCEAHSLLHYECEAHSHLRVWGSLTFTSVRLTHFYITSVRLTHFYITCVRLTHIYIMSVRLTHTWVIIILNCIFSRGLA